MFPQIDPLGAGRDPLAIGAAFGPSSPAPLDPLGGAQAPLAAPGSVDPALAAADPGGRRAVRTAFASSLAERLIDDGMSRDEAAATLERYRAEGAIDPGVHGYAQAWLRGDRAGALPDIDTGPPRKAGFLRSVAGVLGGVLSFAFPAARGVSLLSAVASRATERTIADVAMDPGLRTR